MGKKDEIPLLSDAFIGLGETWSKNHQVYNSLLSEKLKGPKPEWP